MGTTVNARFVNGVFAPLEPVDFSEGALVVLNVEATDIQEPETAKRADTVVPNRSGLLPGMDDPKKMKHLLEDEDAERYLSLRDQDASA